MNANLRNFALWVIIVLLLLALFTLFQNPGQRTSAQDISFSQLLTEVDQGRVRDVVIQGPEIHGTYHRRRHLPDLRAERSHRWSSGSTQQGRADHGAAAVRQRAVVRVAAGLVAALHRADRRVDLPVAPDAGRRAARRMGFGKSRAKLLTEAHGRVTFEDVAGVDEAKEDLQEIVEFLRDPRQVPAARRQAFRAACCWSALPAPARRCSRAPSPARPTCRSSPSRAPTSSRCSSASAPAACATCSSRPRRTRPASSSSTRSTRSAAIAAPASAAATTSASRR